MMRFNPSLTSRLRIGFIVLFALLLLVSLLGVGRLFQIRVDYEDDIRAPFQIELESERLRSAFILEQAASLGAPGQQPSRAQYEAATAGFTAAAARARDESGGNTTLAGELQRWVTSAKRPGARASRSRRSPVIGPRPGCRRA